MAIERACHWIIAAALCTCVFTRTGMAQTQRQPDRKVISKVVPAYPELAKRLHGGGTVKLEVVILANGKVKSTKAIGGNPVLIESATDAVRQWKFEPASVDTTEILQITFGAH